jgi:hypothetical protein
MLRVLLEQRTLVAMLVAIGAGALGVQAYPVDRSSVYLQLIELRSPTVFLVLVYGYATLWLPNARRGNSSCRSDVVVRK